MKNLNICEMVYLVVAFNKIGRLSNIDRDIFLDQLVSENYANKILAK